MKYLFAAVSALALATVPALAQGNGNGNGGGGNGGGNGNRGEQPAQVDHSAHTSNGNAMRDERGGSNRPEARSERQGGPPAARDNGNDSGARGNGGGNNDRAAPPAARGNDNRGGGNRGGPAITVGNGGRGSGNNGRDGDRITIHTGGLIDFVDYRGSAHGLADGCPPGLARKYNGCRPPGLARQQDSVFYRRLAPDWWGYGGLFGDRRGSYFYDDGFLLQLGSDGTISGYIPLLGGALAVGNPWPVDYRYSRMPAYYENYYGLGGPDRYRYADNVVYRLDPETAAITAVAAMLTGDEFVVGQRVPRGYDVYNVPYGYRDRYYDRPDAWYRYNNGYVYQIDPETMLVASVIELVI